MTTGIVIIIHRLSVKSVHRIGYNQCTGRDADHLLKHVSRVTFKDFSVTFCVPSKQYKFMPSFSKRQK